MKRVASRLENTLNFQQKGGSGQKTWYLPQGGSSRSFPPEQSRKLASPKVDADGDTNMSGVNTMKIAQAVINAMNTNQHNQNKRKPPAQWRSPDEFRRLTKEGKCTGCGKVGRTWNKKLSKILPG